MKKHAQNDCRKGAASQDKKKKAAKPVQVSGFERLLTMREVESVTQRTRATLYRWMNKGEFPHPVQPVRYGPNLWPESVIREWLAVQQDRARANQEAARTKAAA